MPSRCTSALCHHRRRHAQGLVAATAASQDARLLTTIAAPPSSPHGRVAAAAARSGGDARRLWLRRSSMPSLNRKIRGRRRNAGVHGRGLGSASMARHRWPRLALSRSLSFSSNMSIYQRGRGGDVEIGSVRFQGQETRRDSGDGERGEKTGQNIRLYLLNAIPYSQMSRAKTSHLRSLPNGHQP
ncbi:hypothetical protein NL676_008494 [Syzygium grande]|nr:hypothetical protein NL676_008494 [Syzygium grande]